MPNLPTPESTVPAQEQVNQPELVEQQRNPISDRVKGLLNRFTSIIRGRKPNPDAALQGIASFPTEEPEQQPLPDRNNTTEVLAESQQEPEILEDPDIARKRADAVKELNEKYNRPWKLDPSDIADFYILSSLVHRSKDYYPGDSENMALLGARERLGLIGDKISYAILRNSLIDNNRAMPFLKPGKEENLDIDLIKYRVKDVDPAVVKRVVPAYLDYAVKAYQGILEQAKTDKVVFISEGLSEQEVRQQLQRYTQYQSELQANPDLELDLGIAEQAIQYQVLDWQRKVKAVDSGEQTMTDLLKDKQGMVDVLGIVNAFATDRALKGAIQDVSTYAMTDKSDPQKFMLSSIYLDSALSRIHSKGNLSEDISNNFPEMSLVLTLHGSLPGDPFNVLYEHASVGLKSELSTRSRSLLQGKVVSSAKHKYTPEERERIIRKVAEYPRGSAYLTGIYLYSSDRKIREAAIPETDADASFLYQGVGIDPNKPIDLMVSRLGVLNRNTTPILHKNTERDLRWNILSPRHIALTV